MLHFTYMKTWVFFAIAVRFLIDGSEEYFIAPSAWYYIKSLGETKIFLGIVLAAFPVGALLTTSIVGKFADKFGYIRFIIIASYVIKVIANLIYTIRVSAYFPLVGRLVSGLADGAEAVFYGQVILYTPNRYRAKVFIILDGMFTLGSLLGPAVSVFLTFHVDILGWRIDAGNSPGIVLALIWLVLLVNALWFPKEFGYKKTTDDDDFPITKNSSDKSNRGSWSRIFLLFYLTFLSLFYTTTVTFYVPVLAQEHFHFPFLQVKLLFLTSSMFCLVLFVLFYLAAEYFAETTLLACAMMMQLVPIAILTCIGFSWDDVSGIFDGYILIFYICLGMPYFSFSLACSLMSKITDPKEAAFYQGSNFAALHLGFVVSRLISAFIFTKTAVLLFCLGLILSWTLGFVWFALEYRNLNRLKIKS